MVPARAGPLSCGNWLRPPCWRHMGVRVRPVWPAGVGGPWALRPSHRHRRRLLGEGTGIGDSWGDGGDPGPVDSVPPELGPRSADRRGWGVEREAAWPQAPRDREPARGDAGGFPEPAFIKAWDFSSLPEAPSRGPSSDLLTLPRQRRLHAGPDPDSTLCFYSAVPGRIRGARVLAGEPEAVFSLGPPTPSGAPRDPSPAVSPHSCTEAQSAHTSPHVPPDPCALTTEGHVLPQGLRCPPPGLQAALGGCSASSVLWGPRRPPPVPAAPGASLLRLSSGRKLATSLPGPPAPGSTQDPPSPGFSDCPTTVKCVPSSADGCVRPRPRRRRSEQGGPRDTQPARP